MRSWGNAQKPQIWPVSLSKSDIVKGENAQTVTIIQQVLKVVRIYQHAKFQAIPSMRSPGLKFPETPNLTRLARSGPVKAGYGMFTGIM